MEWIAALAAAAVTMGVPDGLWLGVAARDEADVTRAM